MGWEDMGNAGSSSSKVFGGSLENQMLSGDDDIPAVLRECTLYIRRSFARSPNLFRIPASRFIVDPPSFGSQSHRQERNLMKDPEYRFRKRSIALYVKLINHDRIKGVPFDLIHDPHILTGMIKYYFKTLDPPLFTYMLYDNFVSAQQNYLAGQGRSQGKTRSKSGGSTSLVYIVKMRSLVEALPSRNVNVLKFMICFFKFLIKTPGNGLDVDEIASIFGPIFLQQSLRMKTRKYRKTASRGNNTKAEIEALKQCILHYDNIFNKSNEVEFARLFEENLMMRDNFESHQATMNKAADQMKEQENRRYQIIRTWSSTKRLRQLFQRWKSKTEMVLGVSSVYGRLRAAEEAIVEYQRKIKELGDALEIASLHVEVKKSIRYGGLYSSPMRANGSGRMEEKTVELSGAA